MEIVKKKKITIATSGPLSIKGGVRGPIDIPYKEDVKVIAQMLMAKYKVYEHLEDGTKILLTFQNYNSKNDASGKPVVKKISEIKATKDKKKLTFVNRIERAQKEQAKGCKPISVDVFGTKTF